MSVIGIGSSNNGYSIGQMMSRMQTRGPSKDEEKTDLSQLVTQLDTDTSGTLDTTDEIQSLADAINRASGVSSDLTEFLSTYDTDQSGTVSEDEALSALEANRPQGPPPPGGMGQPDESDMVNAADENGDGIIDEDEAASLVNIINNATGSDVSVEDFLANYDTDEVAGLSNEEAVAAMQANRPEEAPSTEDSGITAAAMETYLAMSAMGSQNTGDLLTMMQGNSEESINRMA